jgi:hypothetical protein
LLEKNPILSFLNIADNRIGNQGLQRISKALTPKSPLVVLNLSNNDLEGVLVIDSLHDYLKDGKNLLELNLSNNRIGDEAII